MSLLPEIERELLRAARRPLTEKEQTDQGGRETNRTDRRGSAASALLTTAFVLVALAFAGLLLVLLGQHRPTSTTPASHSTRIYRDRAGWTIAVPPGWHVIRFRDSKDGVSSAGAQISNVRLPPPVLVTGSPIEVKERALPARGVGLIIATDSDPGVPRFGPVTTPPLPSHIGGEGWAVGYAPGPPPYVDFLWFRGDGKTFIASTAIGPKATGADRKALAGIIHSVRVQPAEHAAAARFLRVATLRLPTGPATKTFTIAAPAGLPYDVRIAAPARSAVAMTMRIALGTGWTLGTGDNAACRASSGRTACLWHFAAGGNPGGTWTAVVRKDTEPGASVEISITFLKPHTSRRPPS